MDKYKKALKEIKQILKNQGSSNVVLTEDIENVYVENEITINELYE